MTHGILSPKLSFCWISLEQATEETLLVSRDQERFQINSWFYLSEITQLLLCKDWQYKLRYLMEKSSFFLYIIKNIYLQPSDIQIFLLSTGLQESCMIKAQSL